MKCPYCGADLDKYNILINFRFVKIYHNAFFMCPNCWLPFFKYNTPKENRIVYYYLERKYNNTYNKIEKYLKYLSNKVK